MERDLHDRASRQELRIGVFIRHAHFPKPGWFLGSTAVQLWFLPFLLICNIGFYPLMKILNRSFYRRTVGAVLLGLLGSILATGPRLWGIDTGDLSLNSFITFSYDALPSALIGCAWGLWDPRVKPSNLVAGFMFVGLIGLSVGMGFIARNILLETLAGVLGVGFALFGVPGSLMTFLARLGTFSMGIYLIHPLILDVFRVGFRQMNLPTTNLAGYVGLWITATSLSLMFCMILNRSSRGQSLAARLAIKNG